MPRVGGARPGAGRPKGSKNRATAKEKGALEKIARQYTQQAIDTLVGVAATGENESSRVTAAIALLDRGWGKPMQSVAHQGDVGLNITSIKRVIVRPDDPDG